MRLARSSADHGKAGDSKNYPAIEKSAIDYVKQGCSQRT
ncbi:hypothetical protein MGWOODY_XGa870 [hydrothermal vent metagenome]|uniref:Uncharacterized protein n=1 Tax=hydrothermal vent metagenome TaxID=652676 RepID=A0A160TV83_9ZZZZ